MNEAQVRRLIAEIVGQEPLSVCHQTFGHNSITFDVTLPERNVIVRTNVNPQVFASTENNLRRLSQLGLPVPHLLASDLTGTRFPFAYMILNKIPGRDLRYELPAMTREQMARLAGQIFCFQRKVMALPQGTGYGYVGIGEAGPYASWWELIERGNSNEKPEAVEDVVGEWQLRIQSTLRKFEAYFRSVPPTCFLDDVTVKNVIVQNGELQGLVDFDCVCYGDPIYWMALTATGIVSDAGTHALFYIEELKRLWGLTAEQERVLALYSASMVLDFVRRGTTGETTEWRARMLQVMELWLKIAAEK